MTAKLQETLRIECPATTQDVELHCLKLHGQGPGASEAVKLLRKFGEAVAVLDKAAGVIRLVGITGSDGSEVLTACLEISTQFPKQPDKATLSKPIEFNELGRRAKNALSILSGVHTLNDLGDLATLTAQDFSLKNCGNATIRDIQLYLGRFGLKLGMELAGRTTGSSRALRAATS